MRFFKWKITTRIQKLGQNDKIISLANNLIKEIMKSDSDINFEREPQSSSSIMIYVKNGEIGVLGYEPDIGADVDFRGKFTERKDVIIF